MAEEGNKVKDFIGGLRRGQKKADDAKDKVEGAADKVEDAKGKVDAAKDTAGKARDAASDPAGTVKDAAGDITQRAKDKVKDAIPGVPGIPDVPKVPGVGDLLNKGKNIFGRGDLTDKILGAAAGKTSLEADSPIKSFVEKSLKSLGYSSTEGGGSLLADVNGFLKSKEMPGIKSLSEFTPEHLALLYHEAKGAGKLDRGGELKGEWDDVSKMLGLGGLNKLKGLKDLIGEADGPINDDNIRTAGTGMTSTPGMRA